MSSSEHCPSESQDSIYTFFYYNSSLTNLESGVEHNHKDLLLREFWKFTEVHFFKQLRKRQGPPTGRGNEQQQQKPKKQ